MSHLRKIFQQTQIVKMQIDENNDARSCYVGFVLLLFFCPASCSYVYLCQHFNNYITKCYFKIKKENNYQQCKGNVDRTQFQTHTQPLQQGTWKAPNQNELSEHTRAAKGGKGNAIRETRRNKNIHKYRFVYL
jgi:hypothetical protein